MKQTKYILATLAMAISAVGAFAQHTNSAYFTDGYLYRHQMNPAIANEQNYISFPGLANLNFGIRGTLNMEDYIYNVNGRTTTFLNPNVDAKEFLNNIEDENDFNFDTKIQLLSVGFKGFGGYNTIGVNVRANMHTMLPKSLFQFAKEGLANKTYDISKFGIHARSYAEIALGHSHDINEKLRIGANLKFLVGVGNIDAEFNKASLTLGEDTWTAVTNAEVQASVKGLAYEKEISENSGKPYVNGAEIDGAGINGFGFAVDLGAQFKLTEHLTLSASLLDLGSISWDNNMLATTNGDKTFSTSDYKFSFDEDKTNNFEDELDRMTDGLSGLYELDDMGDQGSRSTGIGATLNIGAEYKMPFYERLSAGVLYTHRFQGDYSWTDFRFSANVTPTKWFSAGANFAVGTYGAAFGWILNIHPTGFNLFLGMDQTLGKLASGVPVPLSSNASVNLGINIPF